MRFIEIIKFSLILADDAVESSKNSIICTIIFYSSFIFSIFFNTYIEFIIKYFWMKDESQLIHFLTIKKQIFEDLKIASVTFSNKSIGNEDNEEESQKDYQTNIKEKGINLIKFKSPKNIKWKVNIKKNYL